MTLRRFIALCAACLCASVLAGSTANAAGEEIVVETGALVSTDPGNWIDYAVANRQDAWALGNATCLKLFDYGEVTGDLEFDAAISHSDAGTTQSMTIASGHTFFGIGGPQGPVTAADFKRAFERATSPAMAASIGGTPPARQFVAGIVGASEFFAGTASSISGITANGTDLTFQLTQADGTFLYKLAMPYFCATHASAPAGFSMSPLPAAGPYFVDSASTAGGTMDRQHTVVLARNPEYGGTRIRNLGTIRWVEHGSALAEDYVRQTPPPYVPPAGVQIVPTTTTTIQLLALNTTKPPFDTLAIRRAAAFALDRTALSAVLGWQPTDQFVSPLMRSGDAIVYPLDGSGAATASTLLGGATPAVTQCDRGGQVAALVASQLSAVGFQVTRVSQPPNYFGYIANPANCNLALYGASPDFPDGSQVLEPLFRTGGALNNAFFSDAGFDARFATLSTITDRDTRGAWLAELDADLAAAAPAIAIGHDLRRDAFSDRIGCRLLNQALFGYPINRLCIAVSGTLPPGGGTVSTGAEATPSAPLQTEIVSPSDGVVTITQGQNSTTAPPQYQLLEQQLDITTAPEQLPSNPYVFTFELDGTVLTAAGLAVGEIAVYRNGAPLPDCTGAGATPAPSCVASRALQGDGDGEIVVRTIAGSTWTFGERYDASGGLLFPVKNPPALNRWTAGLPAPLLFRLGGDEGLDVFAAGSPTSVRANCSTFAPIGTSTATESPLGLKFEPRSQIYAYLWKTERSWRNTCRLVTIRFREGSTLTARFRFD